MNKVSSRSPNLWLAALKPPMYTVAVIPILVGTAVAVGGSNHFSGLVLALFLLSAIAIIAWINLSNDVFDSDTGIDVNKAHSVVNLTGNRNLVLWISNFFLVLGLMGIGFITWLQQDYTVLSIIILSCLLGYSYQGPPLRLGYRGLGEVICFITFGPLAIAAAYYSQAQKFSAECVFPAFFVGLTTALILFCSHFHQLDDDQAAGKLSPIVRLGTAKGAAVLVAALIFLYLATGVAIAARWVPWGCLWIYLSLPWAGQLGYKIWLEHDQPPLVSNSKFIAVKLHFTSGVLLSLGYMLSAFG